MDGKTKYFPGHWDLCVSRESTGGKVVESSFEDNLLFIEQECVPSAEGAINLKTRLVDWSDALVLLWERRRPC